MKTSKLSPLVLKKWREFDDALRTDHSFTAAGIIAVSREAEVAVFFDPALDMDEIADLRAVLKENDVPWPNAPKWTE
jgi:hypothetical protein